MRRVCGPADPDGTGWYEIRAQGLDVDESWSEWFGGLTIANRAGITTITGPIADQAALRGVLCRLWDLHMTLLSVRRIDPARRGKAR